MRMAFQKYMPVFLYLALGIVGYVVDLQVQWQKVWQARLETQQLEVSLEEMHQKINHIAQLQKQLEAVKAIFHQRQSMLPISKDFSFMKASLIKAAQNANLSVLSIIPQPAVAKTFGQMLSLHYVFSGTWQHCLNFLTLLNQSQSLMQFPSMKISRQFPGVQSLFKDEETPDPVMIQGKAVFSYFSEQEKIR